MKRLSLVLLLLLSAPHALKAQRVADAPVENDREAIRLAILDYVEGLYLVDPERIEQSVHPDLAKVGFWRPNAQTWYRSTRQDYEMLLNLARTWNADGHVNPETAPRKILILDLLDQTASARLDAEWGTDYLHLAKIDGRWKIINVLWQTPLQGYVNRAGGKVQVKRDGDR